MSLYCNNLYLSLELLTWATHNDLRLSLGFAKCTQLFETIKRKQYYWKLECMIMAKQAHFIFGANHWFFPIYLKMLWKTNKEERKLRGRGRHSLWSRVLSPFSFLSVPLLPSFYNSILLASQEACSVLVASLFPTKRCFHYHFIGFMYGMGYLPEKWHFKSKHV